MYTPDVLVFRDEDGEELPKGGRWFVDVVSAAMLRGVELEGERYASQKDREMVVRKMRFVMAVCRAKGARRVVLGAWGCGAYGNPVGEVASAWRGVLPGGQGKMGEGEGGNAWEGIEEVVFAIKDAGLAARFASAFGEGMVREEEEGVREEEAVEDGCAERIRELEGRIREMEGQAEQARSEQLKLGLSRVLAGLRGQLRSEKENAGRRPEAESAEDVAEDDAASDDGSSGS